MSRRGSFIIVEGIDGSGKDTQAQLLKAGLESRGRNVLLTMSPSAWYRTQPAVASFIESGQTPLRPDTLAVLGAADRMMLIDQQIRPALEGGVDVICVRYTYSALGYFKKRGASVDFVEAVNSLVLPPTHGVLLVLTPAQAVARVEQRDGGTSFEERADYLIDVQAEMRRRWPANFLTVDGGLSQDEIAATTLNYVLGR